MPVLSTRTVVAPRTMGSIRSAILDGVRRTSVSTRSARSGLRTPLFGFPRLTPATFDRILVPSECPSDIASHAPRPHLSCLSRFLDLAPSCAELRCRSPLCSSLDPYVATSHVSYSAPLHVPSRQGTLLPRHPRRCSLLQCPPQPMKLPLHPEVHPLGPPGPAHPS